MSIFARKAASDFEPAPEGLWPAVCCDVIDRGLQKTPWGESYKVEIRWQIEELNEKGKPFLVSERYTNSLHEKSRLRPMLEAWRGKKFGEGELEGFDLEKLIGANCQIQIIHSPRRDGGVWSKVQAVVPQHRAAGKMFVTDDYVRWVDRPENQGKAVGGNEEDYSQDSAPITDEDIPF